MNITNKYGLPETLVRAIRNDPYDPGMSDITVTQLINPPQLERLKREHKDDISEDAIDMLFALQGTSVHHIIERAARGDAVAHKRFYVKRHGVTIGGEIDLLEGRTLYDFKLTSIWSIKRALAEGHPEWEAQMNLLAYLLECNDIKVDTLVILALARDHRKNEALRYDDYPSPAVPTPMPMWLHDQIEQYIETRLAEHNADTPRPCTDEERWAKPAQYALMKKGRKSAVRVMDSQGALEDYAIMNGLAHSDEYGVNLKTGYYIDERPAQFTRCEQYCVAAPFCPQWKKEQQNESV